MKAAEATSVQIGLHREAKKVEKFAADTAEEKAGKTTLIILGVAYTYNRTGKLGYTFKSKVIADVIEVGVGKREGQAKFTWLF
ncbi:MAG: hypothetical protein R3213_01920 [Flavobacteriaceae bacterium]|nr:hypothetical protein [Flavobacteriaceae bacterium]